jgi:hypothetical protein
MSIDGQSADDQVLNLRIVQRFDDGFYAVNFHKSKKHAPKC